MNNAKNEMIEEYAAKVMGLAKDTITVKFRFFDAALAKLKLVPKKKIGDFACDGEVLYYDPNMLLKLYLEEPNVAVRVFLHVLLHCVFRHYNRIDKKNEQYWNLAADIAVENTILELGFEGVVITNPTEHDEMISFTSQLAHIVSSSYIKNPLTTTHYGFSAGSFKDMTRVAKLNPKMWTEIMLDNKDYLVEQIDVLTKNLEDYKKALQENDEEKLSTLLDEGRAIKEEAEKLRNEKTAQRIK